MTKGLPIALRSKGWDPRPPSSGFALSVVLDLDIFLANLTGDGLLLRVAGLAGANFFAHPGLFFDNGFFAAERDIHVLLFEGRFGWPRLAGRDTLDLDVLALEFNGLFDVFGANDFAQTNAAGFHRTFADFDLLFMKGDGGAFL